MANVNISFTIDSTQLARLITALAQKYDCDATSPAVRAAVIADWTKIIKAYETEQALLAAQATVVPIIPPTIT